MFYYLTQQRHHNDNNNSNNTYETRVIIDVLSKKISGRPT
jgi:hypothetical protein